MYGREFSGDILRDLLIFCPKSHGTADRGVLSLTPARSRTSVETDHEINSTAILLPSADSRRVVVSYKQRIGGHVQK